MQDRDQDLELLPLTPSVVVVVVAAPDPVDRAVAADLILFYQVVNS